MQITIAKAVPEDAARILEYLTIIGSETDNLLFGPEGIPIPVETEEKIIEQINTSDNEVMLAVKCGDEIIGIGQISCGRRKRIRHRAELAISLKRAYWGQGLGSRLMVELIEYARRLNANNICLEVRSDNERAKALYRKYGFTLIGVYRNFFNIDGQFFDCDIMELML